MVVLAAVDNFKTLRFHREPQPERHRRLTIAQALNVENTFECLEYLHCRLPPPALDLLSRNLPLLSRLVLNLEHFIGYSISWDQAYNKNNIGRTGNSFEPLPHTDGLDTVCAIARFQNLQHLTLHFNLRGDQILLMHPNPGCEAVREALESIQQRKQGQHLVRFEVVFCADSLPLYGMCHRPWTMNRLTISNTMSIVCSNSISSQGGKKSQCDCTCDNPQYGKVIERRKRFEKVYGEPSWGHYLGRVQQDLSYHCRYPSLPSRIVMESLICLVLLPSYFVFKDGKRVQFKPSLADSEAWCNDFWWISIPRMECAWESHRRTGDSMGRRLIRKILSR